MKRKKRGNRGLRLAIIFICVALLFAVVWGITTVLDRLSRYGDSTVIRSEAADPEPEEENPGDHNWEKCGTAKKTSA